MKCQLVFIHGRAQEHKDAAELKKTWTDSFTKGLAQSSLTLPLDEKDIRFPYYGQTLHDLVEDSEDVADVIVRGTAGKMSPEQDFQAEVLKEMLVRLKIPESEVQQLLDSEVKMRGPQNWEWVQAMLKVVDRHVPGGSAACIGLITRDVYQYLRNPGIQAVIEGGVRQAMRSDIPTVVVSHSLGTVVAYNLLRREGVAAGWRVPLFVTLGSPLAVTMIKRSLSPVAYPTCVTDWYNAMDDSDVVSLYPLDEDNFPVFPQIENNRKVKNWTPNHHSIPGYLEDKAVSARIYQALAGSNS